MRARTIRLDGPTLYLTEDLAPLRAQLGGEHLAHDPARALVNNVSTDEITPAWVCYYYDETLGRYALVGLRGGAIERDAIAKGGFRMIVSGRSKGCGSSRETAPFAELAAGVRVVAAQSFEKIYAQNCQNIGLLATTDPAVIERLARGEEVPIEAFTQGLDPISAAIVEQGGLFAYNKARLAGEVSPPAIETPPRPMTIVEKIIAAHAVVDAHAGTIGVPAVKPGDALFVRADVRFSHDYVTAMADALFRRGFGEHATLAEPSSIFAFRDHLTFLDDVMSDAHRKMGLDAQARELADVQAGFAKKHALRLYGEIERPDRGRGSEAICHNMVIEELASPGQLVIGTDSHTCMAGAIGCFAFGVGSTDMANAFRTRDVRVRVPETVRFVLNGALRDGVCAKDVMLHVLAQPFFRGGDGIGKVLEFGGDGVRALSLDERATLTNMAVEAGGFTGVIEADEVVVDELHATRGTPKEELRARIVKSDEGASYFATFEVDLAAIEPMVATPGDPRNGVPIGSLTREQREVKIDIAYGGSCTGGKRADMDLYARALAPAHARGERVAPGVKLYIQLGSQRIRDYAEQKGYLALFRAVGAEIVEPSCGACIKAGPGVSDRKEQVTVSAINRNFPGRSGPGEVWLASPLVVAASAIAGKIVAPPST
jgi:3-isopropylmalate/(R)-2-methylmalate dehydratase large subunit